MENVSDKSCRENQNTRFMFNNFFFRKIALFIIPKNVVETEGPHLTSQHGAYALHAVLARLHALICMHTLTRPGTSMHARTHLLLFHGNSDSRPLCVTLYVHCLSYSECKVVTVAQMTRNSSPLRNTKIYFSLHNI